VSGRRGLSRRQALALGSGAALGGAGLLIAGLREQRQQPMHPVTVYTFGDSILDCGHYNAHGVHPGALLVRNDDQLFPAFRGRDLVNRLSARLEHRATDGATVTSLGRQAAGLHVEGRAIALLTVGGNDLIRGLARDEGDGVEQFAATLDAFLRELPIRPVLVGTVYDPSFGDDRRNFLQADPALARANHRRVNAALAELAARFGALVDLHAHFLGGDPSWFTHTIEPSLVGASEVRRAFLGPAFAALGLAAPEALR
jgi:acyl-CoA thioesterase-1